jgi:hypothetical protein|tara:strand:+ start:3083 stop:3559 length:477 start_codon:yes stop_codon:yes gene_type:complete
MKATEIINKFKNVLLSVEAEEETPVELSTEVETEVVEEQVELAEETVVEETSLEEEIIEEEVVEEIVEDESIYATKEELSKVVAEFKAMYDQMMDNMGEVESSDVPQELSSDKVELSEETESIAHSPEAEVSSNTMNLYSQKQPKTTKQRVFNKLFNN